MADALTQKDIDSLLLGASPVTPRKPQAEVIPYNFLRPPRISKERRVSLEAIYSRFTLSLQSLFSSRLRMPTDLACNVEQATFAEFTLSIANPCAAFVFDVGGSSGVKGVIDFSTEVAFFMVDRLFGGPGESTSLQRPLTMLERTVMRGIADRTLALLREAWQDHLPLEASVVGFESTPDMLQIANHEDNVLVANIEVRAGPFNGLMTVCLPLLALDAFLGDKTAAAGRLASKQLTPSETTRNIVEQTIRGAQVDVIARFPIFRLAAHEVAAMSVGQIIRTAQLVEGPVEVHVNGRCRFEGVLGQLRRNIGVRITQPVAAAVATGTTRTARGRIS